MTRIEFWPAGGCLRRVTGALILLALLAACAEDELILPGKREDVRAILSEDSEAAIAEPTNESRPISLPSSTNNANWTQSQGTPAHRVANPALSSQLSLIWSADIGSGDGRRQRITATPVAAQGLVFTLDADATVTATSTSGQKVWQNEARPARDKSGQASGGGLAYADGRLYVTIGYGALVVFDAATGGEIWRQRFDGTASGAPTVFGGLVYLTVADDRGWAIRTDNGREAWQVVATPAASNVLGAPAPALSDELAVFAFGSGEVQTLFRRGGLRRWDASVTGERPGFALAKVADVTAAPVIVGNRVYVGNQSGRLVALDLQSGDRVWTADEGAHGRIVPAGDSLFVISDRNELLRLNASDGGRIWGQQLPNFVKDRPRRRSEVFSHHGPLLAGGRIHVASNDGQLRSFDPASGALVGSVEIPGGATTKPVVAGGVLYVVSAKGKLHAFR
ncbi:MAG: PQQ-binding-like beta-propeller repeat protein [Pseudomonadota bacterium]